MKLLYATSIDLPSTRANRIQIVNMSRVFATETGNDFVLGLSRKRKDVHLDFPHVEMGEGRSFLLAWRYLRYAKQNRIVRIYCREEKLLFFMLCFNPLFFRLPIRFYYELHHLVYLPYGWHRFILKRVAGVVSITEEMKKVLVQSGFPAAKILVAPDAVDIELFDIALGTDDARRKLQLPMEKRIVLYAGAIDEPWKGAGVFYEASKQFGDEYLFVLVGGKPHYVDAFQKEFPLRGNVRMEGHQDYYSRLPVYLKAADVLVVPNSGKQEISRLSTSPLKVFAYMAAGRPIVASDLPSIREILNDNNALLVGPDNAQALAEGIRTLAEDPKRASALSQNARRDVEQYTWKNRAEMIVKWMQR